MCSHSPSQVRAFNLGRFILGCVPPPEESCHQQTSSSDPPAGLHLYPAESSLTPDKVKLILTGWALTFCPSTATTQRSWGLVSIPCLKPAEAWLRPVSGHIPARTHGPATQPCCFLRCTTVGARSIHTNHQSYYISLLFKFCDAFMAVDFNNKGEVLCVFLVLRTLSKTC